MSRSRAYLCCLVLALRSIAFPTIIIYGSFGRRFGLGVISREGEHHLYHHHLTTPHHLKVLRETVTN